MKIHEKFKAELDPDNVPIDWWLERYRNWRESELKFTDWTQLPDAPGDSLIWAQYRQELRDLPSVKDFANAEMPARPE